MMSITMLAPPALTALGMSLGHLTENWAKGQASVERVGELLQDLDKEDVAKQGTPVDLNQGSTCGYRRRLRAARLSTPGPPTFPPTVLFARRTAFQF